MLKYFLFSLLVLISFILGYFAHIPEVSPPQALITNQAFIDGLYTQVNLSDEKEVFGLIFSELLDEVVVYPGENYYYFERPLNGYIVTGSIGLLAKNRDDGSLNFGYAAQSRKPALFPSKAASLGVDGRPRIGGGGQYNQSDGVRVEKVDTLAYDVTYQGKTVRFKPYIDELKTPEKAILAEEEYYVGPVFDESGIRFYLVYDSTLSFLFIMLNEDRIVPETFKALNPHLYVGERTGFVFYKDEEMKRMLLVGVNGEHVLENDWYDGPFDHMPDNYIALGLIPSYKTILEHSYPFARGKIDQFGHYTDNPALRIAVGPYTVYFSEKDLAFVDNCLDHESRSMRYECLSQQRYIVPEGYE